MFTKLTIAGVISYLALSNYGRRILQGHDRISVMVMEHGYSQPTTPSEARIIGKQFEQHYLK